MEPFIYVELLMYRGTKNYQNLLTCQREPFLADQLDPDLPSLLDNRSPVGFAVSVRRVARPY
jgi:hypothetical protein